MVNLREERKKVKKLKIGEEIEYPNNYRIICISKNNYAIYNYTKYYQEFIGIDEVLEWIKEHRGELE